MLVGFYYIIYYRGNNANFRCRDIKAYFYDGALLHYDMHGLDGAPQVGFNVRFWLKSPSTTAVALVVILLLYVLYVLCVVLAIREI
jgi:hypothetical protein